MKEKYKRVAKLVISIVVANLAGIIGSVFTSSAIPSWHSTLTKPLSVSSNYIKGIKKY